MIEKIEKITIIKQQRVITICAKTPHAERHILDQISYNKRETGQTIAEAIANKYKKEGLPVEIYIRD